MIDNYKMVVYQDLLFEALFERSWLDEDWIRDELVQVEYFHVGVDPFQVLLERGLTPLGLAGGTRTLLLARHADYVLDFARMGQNCYPYLMDIADTREVTFGKDHSYAEFDNSII